MKKVLLVLLVALAGSSLFAQVDSMPDTLLGMHAGIAYNQILDTSGDYGFLMLLLNLRGGYSVDYLAKLGGNLYLGVETGFFMMGLTDEDDNAFLLFFDIPVNAKIALFTDSFSLQGMAGVTLNLLEGFYLAGTVSVRLVLGEISLEGGYCMPLAGSAPDGYWRFAANYSMYLYY
jgi:hypothetical protein